MFELADCLTGIYKVNDCTNSNTIDNVAYDAINRQSSTQQPALASQSQQLNNNLFDELREAVSQITANSSNEPQNRNNNANVPMDVRVDAPVDNDAVNVDASVDGDTSVNVDATVDAPAEEPSNAYETSIADSGVDESVAEPMQLDNAAAETSTHSQNDSDMFAAV